MEKFERKVIPLEFFPKLIDTWVINFIYNLSFAISSCNKYFLGTIFYKIYQFYKLISIAKKYFFDII